jgi:PhnB protein
MKKITPNIAVENCEQTIQYYQQVFGGEIKGVNKTPDGKIMHAELHVNPDCVFYFNDVFDGKTQGDNISLVLEMDSEEEMNRLYQALKEGGTVNFELQKTFWGAFHAVVLDKHGVIWSLNYMVKE